MKCVSFICFAVLINVCATSVAMSKDKCQRCMRMEECPVFAGKSPEEQRSIMEKFSCEEPREDTPVFGFSSVAKGDQVCCPDLNVWGIESSNKKDEGAVTDDNRHGTDNNRPVTENDSQNESVNENSQNKKGVDAYEQSRISNRRWPMHGNWFNPPLMTRPNMNVPQQQPITRQDPNFQGQNFGNSRRPNAARPSGASNWNNQNLNAPGFVGNPSSNFNNPQNNFNQGSFSRPNNNNFIGNINAGNGNSNRRNLGGPCSAITSIPPSPEIGCCGIDVANGNRFPGVQNGFGARPARPRPRSQNTWTPPAEYLRPNDPWGNRRRFLRAANNATVNITLDNRIAGGKETQLEQFPWTVLLATTFDYGDRQSTFSCGGSIISARYVLTAAHCVVDENARVNDIKITLAEYDKRTFPQDCVRVPGEGRKCIQNIEMSSEDFVAHPGFDDRRLQNDIALIRLRENAPYTDFIRPICLPPIDIDNPDYSDLRLAVAGWGRNGRYTSQVKQSTVVNLVPQRECKGSYPQLTRRHLCAAGHSGEDTCKGDSGGPLMMLYQGQYYVSGVVSGKRADTPCGTPSTPSLYTNVYHYLDWIKSNIRN